MTNKYEIVKKMAYDLNTSEMPDEPNETMLDRIIDESERNLGYKQGFIDGILFLKCCITGKFTEMSKEIDKSNL